MWSKHIISVKTVDDWNVPLEFTARVFKRANGKLLVDFRRIQGIIHTGMCCSFWSASMRAVDLWMWRSVGIHMKRGEGGLC